MGLGSGRGPSAPGSGPSDSRDDCDVCTGFYLWTLRRRNSCRCWSMLSGLLAYGFCRKFGRPAARWIAGEKGLARGEVLFRGAMGGWMVALSRWLPVFPEVISCVAGLTRMPFRRFCLALACGSLPLGFGFAAIGDWGHEYPMIALVLSAGLPPLLWIILGPLVVRGRESPKGESPEINS